jgi:hypothetical protein
MLAAARGRSWDLGALVRPAGLAHVPGRACIYVASSASSLSFNSVWGTARAADQVLDQYAKLG